MLKKAAAALLVCASVAMGMGCGTTKSRFVYAAIPASNEIVAFREDPNAGVLTQLAGSPITAGLGVEALALHPSKKFMYAANSGQNNISLFTLSSTGGITEVTPRTNTGGTAPTVMVMDAAGTYLYVGNAVSFDISVFSIDSSTGALTPVPQASGPTAGIGMSPLNMQLSPSGNILYVTGQAITGVVQAFQVNGGVLSQQPVPGSPFTTGNNPYGLTIAPGGGFLYTANKLDNSISEFTINADGSLTPLPGSPLGETGTGPLALLIENSGKYLYVVNNQSPGNLLAYSIGGDGSLTLASNSQFSTGAQPSVIASDPSGKYLFVGNESSAAIQSLSLNTGSGILTSVASYSVPGAPTAIVVTP
ncbi:MAG TPA: beta-propeller fold lactonase family protein [Candidatus Sulfotelmatobacter sp.]|nr:beta-propeller fold lactonase family protein [Candidatus Sulfotelmatobacter sp.]